MATPDPRNIAYVPLWSPSLLTLHSLWNQGFQANHTPLINLIRPDTNAGVEKVSHRFPLRKVYPRDKLYILLHTLDIEQIGALDAQDGLNGAAIGGRSFTPELLAQEMRAQKLTGNIMDIRVLASYSGVSNNGAPSFCERFAAALYALGYVNCTVTGYLGHLDLSYSLQGFQREAAQGGGVFELAYGRHKFVTLDDGMRVRASDARGRIRV